MDAQIWEKTNMLHWIEVRILAGGIFWSIIQHVKQEVADSKFHIAEMHAKFLAKRFVKATFLLKKLLKNWFDEKIFGRERIMYHFSKLRIHWRTIYFPENSFEYFSHFEIHFDQIFAGSFSHKKWFHGKFKLAFSKTKLVMSVKIVFRCVNVPKSSKSPKTLGFLAKKFWPLAFAKATIDISIKYFQIIQRVLRQ